MTRAWIFQGNPDQFAIDRYLDAQDRVRWTVRQPWYAQAMAVGDRVYFWRAAGKDRLRSGIIASGHLADLPSEREEDAASLDLWITPMRVGKQMRVDVQLDARGLTGGSMLDRLELLDDEVTRGLTILKMANQTNYPVDDHVAARIESLWTERAIPLQTSGAFGAQGFVYDAAVRAAVERRAMEVALARYVGFEDVSSRRPYDLEGQINGARVHVEVKGSQSEVDRVQVTVGEVRAARSSTWRTDLVVVDGIVVERTPDGPRATGGRVRVFEGWAPCDADLAASVYWCRLPTPAMEHEDGGPAEGGVE